MTNKRYIIEITDEFGKCDYDRFESSDTAIAVAKELADSGLNPIIVDSQEMLMIWVRE